MDRSIEGEFPSSFGERTTLIPETRPRSRKVLCATLISIWGTFSFGYSLGYSSPASYDLQSNSSASVDVRLDSSQQSWFSVSVTVNDILDVTTLEGIIYSILLFSLKLSSRQPVFYSYITCPVAVVHRVTDLYSHFPDQDRQILLQWRTRSWLSFVVRNNESSQVITHTAILLYVDWDHDSQVIFLIEISSLSNLNWSVIVAFFKNSSVVRSVDGTFFVVHIYFHA